MKTSEQYRMQRGRCRCAIIRRIRNGQDRDDAIRDVKDRQAGGIFSL